MGVRGWAWPMRGAGAGLKTGGGGGGDFIINVGVVPALHTDHQRGMTPCTWRRVCDLLLDLGVFL